MPEILDRMIVPASLGPAGPSLFASSLRVPVQLSTDIKQRLRLA